MGQADTDPFARLLADHADFREKLTELEATLDEMMARREATDENRELVDEAFRFFGEELMPHFRLEEEVVLPALEARIGRFGTLVNVIAYEHDEIRREIAKLRQARAALSDGRDPWPAIQELNRHGIFAIQFLADHFRKERTSLFPTARSELTPRELDAIRSRLAFA
ncbi:MAG: hemerythrin domain-containing protein [Methanobacteriota archaeon]